MAAGVPVGFGCRLTVEQGAVPGAGEEYERRMGEICRGAWQAAAAGAAVCARVPPVAY